jgi:hypothetical protein
MRRLLFLGLLAFSSLVFAGKEIAITGVEYFDVGESAMVRHGGVSLDVGDEITVVDERGGPVRLKAKVLKLIGKKSVAIEILEKSE